MLSLTKVKKKLCKSSELCRVQRIVASLLDPLYIAHLGPPVILGSQDYSLVAVSLQIENILVRPLTRTLQKLF